MAQRIFTSITIRNCVDGAPSKPITLDFSVSFPAPAYYPVDPTKHVSRWWAYRKAPRTESTLEVTLLERISEGRIGVVYFARVDKATREGADITSSLPSSVCLKFAKQHHCRSLAREAWFYEQLRTCQGTSIPKFYGFYTSTVREQAIGVDSFKPWAHLEYASQRSIGLAEKLPSMDTLLDDFPAYSRFFTPSKFKSDSPWFKWNLDEQNPTIGVMVLEKLGERCEEFWPRNASGDKYKDDILAVLDDVAKMGLCHTDVTARNLLRFASVEGELEEQRCPRHNAVHEWRLIDFDRSCKLDLTNTGFDGKWSINDDKDSVGHPGSFWGYVTLDED